MNNNENIPENILKLAESSSIFTACEKIGEKLGLHIDQVGELDAEIRQIILGRAHSENFVDDIKKSLEIETDLAEKIVAEVNVEIFQAIKNEMQQQTEAAQKVDVANLEQMGKFKVEPHTADPYRGKIVTSADKNDILSSIENPAPSPEIVTTKIPEERDLHTESIVEHFLTSTAAQPEQTTTQPVAIPAENTPAPTKIPEKKSGPDQYREPIA